MQNGLDGSESPGATEDAVEVRASTSYGDIVVNRVLEPAGERSVVTVTATQPALEVTGLRKSFGDTVALDGIDLRVAAGTVFALLGPNGAGKTTAVQILSTLIDADAGEVRVDGHDPVDDPDAVRRVIGVTGQFSAVDSLLTGEENLALMADLCHLERAAGRRRIAELLERFDLVDAASQAGRHLLGRHAPPPRPRDDPGGRPADHLPGRADDRPRPAEPARRLADRA